MSRDPHVLLGEAQSLERQGRLPEAIATYQRLLGLRADLPDAWYNLAVLLRRTGQFSAALACYQHALNRGVAQPEEAHLNRGVIYSDCLQQYAAAEHELQQALALNPAFIPALFNLANLQEDQGRADDARATYRRLLALQPNNADALARYAGLMRFESPQDPLIQRLRELFGAAGVSDADCATLAFALGRALDSCGAYSAAFQAYVAANGYSRASAPPGTPRYDRAAQERFVDRCMAAFPVAGAAPAGGPTPAGAASAGEVPPAGGSTPAGAASAGGPALAVGHTSATGAAMLPRAAGAGAGPRPIFICGMFRSGSTLIEQLIADRTQVTAGGELDFLPNIIQTALAPFPESLATLTPARLDSLAAQYLQSLAAVFPTARYVTDKRPDNFLYIGLIKRLFPDAKIVHTTRDALDNCLSIFFLHLDQRMSYALDLDDIGHYFVQYRRLMQHWKSLYGADIHDVDYDVYVRQPEREAQRLFEFLGVASEPASTGGTPAKKRAIRTASVWQVREPLYQRSSGRSRHYAAELATLRKALGA